MTEQSFEQRAFIGEDTSVINCCCCFHLYRLAIEWVMRNSWTGFRVRWQSHSWNESEIFSLTLNFFINYSFIWSYLFIIITIQKLQQGLQTVAISLNLFTIFSINSPRICDICKKNTNFAFLVKTSVNFYKIPYFFWTMVQLVSKKNNVLCTLTGLDFLLNVPEFTLLYMLCICIQLMSVLENTLSKL